MKGLGKILRFLWPYRWYAVANIVFNALGAFFSLFSLALMVPFLGVLFGTNPLVEQMPRFALSVDTLRDIVYYYISRMILEHGREVALLWVIAFVVINALLKNLFTYLALWFLADIRNGVVRDVRNLLYQKILALPMGYYSEERKGDIMSKMANDVSEVEASIMRSLDMFFKNPVIILVHLSGLLLISGSLTLFVLVLLPISGLFIGRIGKNLKHQSSQTQQQLGSLLASIEETLSGLRIIKAFNAERKTYEHFARENEDYTRLQLAINRRRDLASPLSEFLGTMVMGIVLWYGGKLVLDAQQHLTPQALIGFMGLFYMILNPAKSFSSAYFNILKGMASADRIETILQAENPIQNPPSPLPAPSFASGIEYRDLRFAYQTGREVLRGVNLRIEKGMTVALVGQSGSGKTTMVDLLPRFYDPQRGAILIDGHDIREYRVEDVRGLMGNVNQDPILFNDSFHNNIAFGVEGATREEVIAAAKIANAHEFIMATERGYDSVIGDRGGKLSGGQRQRLSIARAILKNPPIMILDEATSALDTESERLVQEALENLMRNRTSLVIAHRLSTIRNADLICVMQDGQIVERGHHEELLAREGGVYARLYSMQV